MVVTELILGKDGHYILLRVVHSQERCLFFPRGGCCYDHGQSAVADHSEWKESRNRSLRIQRRREQSLCRLHVVIKDFFLTRSAASCRASIPRTWIDNSQSLTSSFRHSSSIILGIRSVTCCCDTMRIYHRRGQEKSFWKLMKLHSFLEHSENVLDGFLDRGTTFVWR